MTDNKHIYASDNSETNLLRSMPKILNQLLLDQTTGENIKWATDNYSHSGYDFSENRPIKINLITGWFDGLIRPRAEKDSETQLERTRNKAEVFTPSWVIDKQVLAAMEDFHELPLDEFIITKWLEITCGEGPYMANRYDMDTGQFINLHDRVGFIDRKFQRLNREVAVEKTWIDYAISIYQSSYGYEYQGDSLLLARENLLLTFIDNYFFMFGGLPDEDLLLEITNIISLNVFQMDGLTYEVPYSEYQGDYSEQLSLFDDPEEDWDLFEIAKMVTIRLWDQNKTVEFIDIVNGDDEKMKFDVVIGNPPYQIEDGGASASAKPIYNHFVEEGKKISNRYLSLVIPTRWYVGGKGLNQFRENMLNDNRIKILHDFLNPAELFPNTNIRGGVCFFLWDNNYDYINETRVVTHNNGVIISDIQRPMRIKNSDIFIRSAKAPDIIEKVMSKDFESFESHVSSRKPFGLATTFSKNTNYHDKPDSLNKPILCYSNGMKIGYVEDTLIKLNRNWIDKYKLYTPRANNIGTELSDDNLNTHIGKPNTICTESYLVVGADLNLNIETLGNLKKYLTTKFFRYMHSLAKASHDATAKTYRFVPLQNFTSSSDIDWSQSIPEIDQQLYKKYNLSQEEIDFIDTNVKEMV